MQDFFKSGKTVIYVSHNLSSVKQLCTRAVLMHKGEMLLTGSPDLIINQYHKLIYDGIEKESENQIVQEIKELGLNSTRVALLEDQLNKKIVTKVVEPIKKTVVQEFYDSEFISKNKHEKKIKNISIEEYGIRKKGEPDYINNLLWGNDYEIEMIVRFHELSKDIRFGFVLYDHAYNELNSYFFPQHSGTISEAHIGDCYCVKAKFHCFLSDAVFGLRLEVRSLENGVERAISYISDALLIKSHGNPSTNGDVNFFSNIELREVCV